jgi:hypothetical protein
MAESASNELSKGESARQVERSPREQTQQFAVSSPHADILFLQQTAGNRAVSRLLQSSTNRPPLAGALLQRKCTSCSKSGGECAECSTQREATVQRSPAPAQGKGEGESRVSPLVNEALRSPGHRLDPSIRAFMELRFGRNLGHVRIHTNAGAARAADSIDAAAFTVGDSVWFGYRQYQPNKPEGLHLLAHELAHTIQQRGNAHALQANLRIGDMHDPSETAADRAADAILDNNQLPHLGVSAPFIRRRPKVLPVPAKSQERFVDLDNGDRYRVVRHVKPVEHKETYRSDEGPKLRGRIDKDNIWLQVDWCRNTTRGDVKVGVNLPGQAQEFLKNLGDAILKGEDPRRAVDKVELTPFASVVIAQSKRFRVTGEAKVNVDPGGVKGGSLGVSVKLPNLEIGLEAKVTKPPEGSQQTGPAFEGGVTVKVPFGGPEEVKCPIRERVIVIPQITYECFKEIPEHPEKRTRPVTRSKVSYLYFKYAQDKFETNTKEPGGARNPTEMAQLEAWLKEGFQATTISGHASPEGPQAPKGKFIGNVALSEKRAEAAKKWIEDKCQPTQPSLLKMRPQEPLNCFTGQMKSTGEGELYTLTEPTAGGDREVEGKALAEHAVEQFKEKKEDPKQDREARHRTPEVLEELEKRKKSPERQAKDVVYPLLRRAEITLTKQEEEEYEVKIPASSQKQESCRPEVVDAVENDFERSQMSMTP